MALLDIQSIEVEFDGFRAVDRVSLALAPGELIGLAGTNGAGKSTVFGAVAGQVPITSGVIRFADHDITRLPAHRRARLGLGRTFQVPREFGSLSVLDNLLAASPDEGHESLLAAWFARAASRQTDLRLTERADELLGLTRLSALREQPASALSGGQKKLLELARAMMRAPTCLLLDEPFAGVNPVLIDQLIEVLRAIHARGVALIVIEHHLQALKSLVPRLLVMDQGQVIADGAPAAVLDDARVRAAYMGGVV